MGIDSSLQEKKSSGEYSGKRIPILPLKDVVVFPRVAMPIIVRRPRSLSALNHAMKNGEKILLLTQKDSEGSGVVIDDFYHKGTMGTVRESIKQDDGSVRVLVEGVECVRLLSVDGGGDLSVATVESFSKNTVMKGDHVEALRYSVLNQFRRIVNMGANVPFDVLLVILNVSDAWYFCNLIAAHLDLTVEEKMKVLSAASLEEKLRHVSTSLGRQEKVLQMASEIQTATGKELDKMQREMYLREQMKSIERELAHLGVKSDFDALYERIENADLPEMVRERAQREYDRLKAMPSYGPEVSMLRAYLDWIIDLPWGECPRHSIDMIEAKAALDEGHDGLEKVKERIVEHLAVQKLSGDKLGSILCFVGPPGTGKTSIGRAIAKATGRAFHRISLGGVRDEAEIRGHRRTYVGALPGRIIQGIAAVSARNPVFMLDEIDKLASDFRGDPASALLEVLDPEQNVEFSDHYLEVPFDLSDTLFIMTANRVDTIPHALRDRMEIIEFSSYTDEEKFSIAKKYLVKKAVASHGLKKGQCDFSDDALRTLIENYTREAGVRELDRVLKAVCRKVARKIVEGKKRGSVRIVPATIARLLGPVKVIHEGMEKKDMVGVATGLAWTEVGGEILHVEATLMSGKGNLLLTGQLGDVMQESAKAAVSYVRAMSEHFGITRSFHLDTDIHIHVPSGAIPKDGPSAGVAIVSALVSSLTGRSLDRTVAMTGEITLRGRVLEVGGVKEKVIAAHRAGFKTVIIPKGNKRDLEDVPVKVKEALYFVFVQHIDDVVKVAIVSQNSRRDFARARTKSTTRHACI